MTHSKDYIEARRHAQALANLQSLLESDIDKGKQCFIENGYISFSTETDNAMSIFTINHFTCCKNKLDNWLAEWGWEIKVADKGISNGKSALFAIKP